MQLKMIGLGPKIGGTAESPHASANVLIQNIDPSYNVADIAEKVTAFVDPVVIFTVPDTQSDALYRYTKLYLKSVDPDFIGAGTAVAAVTWDILKAAPLSRKDGKKNSDTPKDQLLGPEYSFDTQGGTIHITQSVFTRAAISATPDPSLPVNFSAPSVNRAIGVERADVKGCDVSKGDLKWGVKINGLNITTDYIASVRQCTGTVNRFDFYGRAREELLFLGASFNYKPGSAWEGTFNFHEAPTQNNVFVCNGIMIPEIRGHDYVWISYKTAIVNNSRMQVPQFAYCEQVYQTSDFGVLLNI